MLHTDPAQDNIASNALFGILRPLNLYVCFSGLTHPKFYTRNYKHIYIKTVAIVSCMEVPTQIWHPIWLLNITTDMAKLCAQLCDEAQLMDTS